MSVVAGSVGPRGRRLFRFRTWDFTERRGYIRDEQRPGAVTLREVLLREWEIVQTAKEGVVIPWPLVANPRPADPKLDDEQRRALDALFSSINTVSVFRGGAGTGKSFVLHELVEQLRSLAATLLFSRRSVSKSWKWKRRDFRRPPRSPISSSSVNWLNAVVVVDEAGQIGGRQMLELMRLVRERNARMILSGDTRQHGAVEASDALLAIERHAGVRPVELHKDSSARPGAWQRRR